MTSAVPPSDSIRAPDTTGTKSPDATLKSRCPPDEHLPENASTGRTEAFTSAASFAARSAGVEPSTSCASTMAAPVTMGVAMDVPLKD